MAGPSDAPLVFDPSFTDDEHDSLYGSATATDTTSLSRSVTQYKYENGRRYHAYSEGSYWAPNDEQQNEQLNIFHHVYSLVLDGELYKAPIGENPQNIFDIGTGTGIWAIDMADKFPSAQVLGNDLSPIQPSWVPSNVQFEVDDCTQEWTHRPGSFDFIHARALYGSIPDWPRFIGQVYRTLQPGGWFESVETTFEHLCDDDSIPKESAAREWCRMYGIAGEKIGKTFELQGKVKPLMEDQGFVDVVQYEYKVPIGSWPANPKMKEIGKYNLMNFLEAIEGFTLALFTRVLRWEPVEVRSLLPKVKQEYLDRKVHSYYRMFVVVGKKPEA